MRTYIFAQSLIMRIYKTRTFFDYTHIVAYFLIMRKYRGSKIFDYAHIAYRYYAHPPHILCSSLLGPRTSFPYFFYSNP